KTARNLGVIIDDQLTFTAHIASVSRSCRFALYNIRKIRSQYATQLLVQTLVISRLDNCNAILIGLPACVVKPLQMAQNVAAHLMFNQPKRAHVILLLIELHLLPVVQVTYACLQSDCCLCSHVVKCSCKCKCYPRMLRSFNERRLALPSVQAQVMCNLDYSHL